MDAEREVLKSKIAELEAQLTNVKRPHELAGPGQVVTRQHRSEYVQERRRLKGLIKVLEARRDHL